MEKDDEEEWLTLMNHIHSSVKGGMRYNTGKLLLVLYRPLDQDKMTGPPTAKTENTASVDGSK